MAGNSVAAPTAKELDSLAPLVVEHRSWAEENRRQHPEVIEALHQAGLFDLRRPPQLGGSSASYAEIYDLVASLSAIDGSTGWTVAVNTITSWMASHLPDPVLKEVFDGPTQLCGTLSPGGTIIPDSGGQTFTLNGQWKFISGAPTSQWQVVIAVTPVSEDSSDMVPAYAVVPVSDLLQIDDWHTTGLRGTGSISTVADQVTVPAERVGILPPLLSGQGTSSDQAANPQFGSPLVATAAVLSVGVAPGLARSALREFRTRISTKPITYTSYERQSEAPVTHIQLAEASLLVEESEFQARALTHLVDQFDGTRQDYWSNEARFHARARLGRSADLALKATRLVADASGGSSIYLDAPVQHQLRDLQAMSMHALITPGTNYELYGRSQVGLEPSTLYF